MTLARTNAVAVVGTNTWDAWQAAKRLSLRWNLPAAATSMNSAQFLADAQRLAVTATPFVAGAANAPGTLYTVERSTADAVAATELKLVAGRVNVLRIRVSRLTHRLELSAGS